MATMNKRAVLKEFRTPLVIEEKPIPEPPPKGLVVKVSLLESKSK